MNSYAEAVLHKLLTMPHIPSMMMAMNGELIDKEGRRIKLHNADDVSRMDQSSFVFVWSVKNEERKENDNDVSRMDQSSFVFVRPVENERRTTTTRQEWISSLLSSCGR